MNDIVKHEQRKPALAAGAKVAAIVPTNFEETYRVAQAIVKSGMAPRGLNTPEKAMVAIMHGMEVGMTPMVALQSIAVINGNPAIWGDGAIGLVRGSGHMEWIEETQQGQGDNLTAVCLVKRKGEEKPIEGSFSVAQAKKAGLWGKQGPWSQYPERMLKMRARAFALRDGFADILRGLSIREEVEDYPERIERHTGGNTIFDRARERQQDIETTEGFDQSSIEEQLQDAQSEPEDIIDAEPESEAQEKQQAGPEASTEQEEGVANLSEGQIELLSAIEEALSGCRNGKDIDAVLNEFGQDVIDAGELFQQVANKAVHQRRAEIGA